MILLKEVYEAGKEKGKYFLQQVITLSFLFN